MLTKLMKYEFKSTARIFLPFYAAVIGIALLSRIFSGLSDLLPSRNMSDTTQIAADAVEAAAIISVLILIFAIVIVCCLAPVLSIHRFHTNLLKDEGYLMMTLPVKATTHIWCKLHTMVIWTVISFCVAMLSGVIILFSTDALRTIADVYEMVFSELGEFFRLFFESQALIFLLELLVMLILGIYTIIITFYACLTLGHHFSKKHPILTAMGWYMLISFVTSIVNSVFTALIGTLVSSAYSDSYAYYTSSAFISDAWTSIHIFSIYSILFTIAQFALFYFITNKILSRHLNLA